MENELTAKDYILLLLCDKPVYGALFLQLIVFLIVEEIKPDLRDELRFRATDTGPYSTELIKILKELDDSGFLSYEDIDDTVAYSITETGESYIKSISFPPEVRSKIRNLKKGSDRLGYTGVLRYVFFYYPDFFI